MTYRRYTVSTSASSAAKMIRLWPKGNSKNFRWSSKRITLWGCTSSLMGTLVYWCRMTGSQLIRFLKSSETSNRPRSPTLTTRRSGGSTNYLSHNAICRGIRTWGWVMVQNKAFSIPGNSASRWKFKTSTRGPASLGSPRCRRYKCSHWRNLTCKYDWRSCMPSSRESHNRQWTIWPGRRWCIARANRSSRIETRPGRRSWPRETQAIRSRNWANRSRTCWIWT